MLLGINTTTADFSAALLREDGKVLTEFFLSPGAQHFNHLMPILNDLFEFSKAGPRDIEAVAVATGPGSFTGLRVGLSAAKGFCQGLRIPIIGVSSLEAMAAQIAAPGISICPVIASRRDEVFTALFEWTREGRLRRLREDVCLKFRDLPSFAEGDACFIGHDFERQGEPLREAFGPRILMAPSFLWGIKASSIAARALGRFHERDFDELSAIVPSYLRPPDIRPNPYPLLPGREAPSRDSLS